MAKYVDKGDTLFADHADTCSRDIKPKRLTKNTILGKSMFLYECSRNSTVEIIKEIDSERLKILKKQDLHTDCGDILEADSISVYVDSRRPQKYEVIGGVSGRHKAQLMNIRKESVSTIKYPIESLIKCLDEKKALESKKEEDGSRSISAM